MAIITPINIKDPTLRLTISVTNKDSGQSVTLQDYFPIQSLEITHEVNKLSAAEITIVYEETNGKGFVADPDNNLAPGNKIEIMIAYGDAKEKSIFKGKIMKQRLQMKSAAAFQVVVSCKHAAIGLTMEMGEKYFPSKTDSDIIKALIQENKDPLTPEVDSVATVMEYMTKPEGTSYWDFILSRAEFNGFMVTLDGDKVLVEKPKPGIDPVLRVALGESIITCNAEINTENQPASVEASCWDIKKLEEIKVESAEPSLEGPLKKAISEAQFKEKIELKSNTPLTQDELQAWADGRLLRTRLSAFKGQVTCIGTALAKPGTNIELDNIGENYNGNVYVSYVKHDITDGQWTTTIKFGVEDKSVTEKANFNPKAAEANVPSVQGLQVATVKKIFDDPDSEFRIQITLPSKTPDPEGVWARLSNLYATQSAGSVFFPEIGDEVIVGFLQGNPRFPIVLGSLYSSTRACPDPAKDNDNYTKAIITKSKLTISFDDEKKVITISTPGGNTITMDDDKKQIEIKDQNSNSIKMSSGGIDIQSEKDINLKATGNISLNATGKLSVSANQDVDVAGININNTAKVGFTAKGNATAELSASGQTTVKGGIVMIN